MAKKTTKKAAAKTRVKPATDAASFKENLKAGSYGEVGAKRAVTRLENGGKLSKSEAASARNAIKKAFG